MEAQYQTPIDAKGMKIYASAEVLPNGAPTVSNAYLADLMTRQIELLEEQNRLIRQDNTEWVTADEAAAMLGKTVKPGGSHKNVLTYLRTHTDKKGRPFLRTFGQLRPYTYLRAEVKECLELIKAGRLVTP